ncbi:MAG: glycosyltransferase [Nitrospirota bacterium]
MKDNFPVKAKPLLKNTIYSIYKNRDTAARKAVMLSIEKDNIMYDSSLLNHNDKLNIALYIGQLGPGGAERQLCNLAIRLNEMGHTVRVLTITLRGKNGHYLPYLFKRGISVKQLEHVNSKKFTSSLINSAGLEIIPYYMKSYIYDLLNELCLSRPDVLHCWLDYCNIIGGLAGFISAVPKIILNSRNVNPTHLVWLNWPWFKPWYEVLIMSKRISVVNNSVRGAADYAQWLNIASSNIAVVKNSLIPDQFKSAEYEDGRRFRDSLGISHDAPVIGGIFRFTPEKRPIDFMNVIRICKKKYSELKVVIAGIGPMEYELKQYINRHSLGDTVFLVGRRRDIFLIIRAFNVLLLTSENDGLPNTLMEASYLGIPVVATKAGGIPEIVKDGVSGELHDVGDIENMAKSITRILSDKLYARKLGLQGQRIMKEEFSVEKMADGFLNIYKLWSPRSG